MARALALPLALAVALFALLAAQASPAQREAFRSRVEPLPASVRTMLEGRFWRPGCPVPLSDLRLLTVTHWGFDGEARPGQLVVNERAARPLAHVFRQLYRLRFPIRHLQLRDLYGPPSARPKDGDVSGSFVCREAVPSPCVRARVAGTLGWSNHAYGLAVDLNPIENPYVGCGRVHDPRSRPYVDRTLLRMGMVTPGVVAAFRAIGWGWGGDWTGNTKDYMHFSVNGR